MQDRSLDLLDRPQKLPNAKLDGNLVAKVAQDGPKWCQDGPRWPDKGSQTYDHRIYPLIAARVGGHFGAILGCLKVSGANLGVFERALGLDVGAL